MDIVSGRSRFGLALRDFARDERMHFRTLARMVGVAVPDVRVVQGDASVEARVYRNQWIVDCPDCRNAEYVWIEEPVFMCSNCWNAAAGGKWRPVTLPAFQGAIEKALKARPVPANRNWTSGETYQQLRAENVENGLPEEVS